MEEEMNALEKNHTWELVDILRGEMTSGCKWMFTVKHKSDVSVDKYKVHLVAK